MNLLQYTFVFLCFNLYFVCNVIGDEIQEEEEEETSRSRCPEIVTRMGWGARTAVGINYLVFPLDYVIVHHTVSGKCTTKRTCSQIVRNIQTYCIDDLEYWDIGYNFLIGNDGRVYEGVGWHKEGAHTYKWNKKSIGIAFIGDFSETLPTDRAIKAAKDLLACGVELGELSETLSLFGGRQFINSESPGLALYQEIQNWVEWNPNVPLIE